MGGETEEKGFPKDSPLAFTDTYSSQASQLLQALFAHLEKWGIWIDASKIAFP
jgi:hypothetical protein